MDAINRYKKANVPLDTVLRGYYAGEMESLVTVLQKVSLLVAEKLLNQPDGAYAVIYGHAHWVSPVGSLLRILSSPELNGETGLMDYLETRNAFPIWTVGSLDIADVQEYIEEMKKWPEEPTFYFIDQDYLDKCALEDQGNDVIQETLSLIQAVKESKILEGHIMADVQQEKMEF